ncbi:MAG: hypothetical protein MUC61_03885 [Amoebophilaceae bacterium]|jgi:hypothetical protein|nr:hypothetical protein [Amoebophilaceae bacterium]
MKKISIVLAALLFFTVGSPVSAKKKCKKHQKTTLQRQRAEIKVWKQRKAAMQPLQLRDLVEENCRLKTKNQEMTEEVESVKGKLEQLIILQTQIEGLKNSQSNAATDGQAGMHNHPDQEISGFGGFGRDDWAVDQDHQFYIRGLVFKVQIGAYKKRDLSHILEGGKLQDAFEQKRSGDVNEYTLGHFRDYWKANQFKKELRAMGLKDAWIVAFKDGKRIPLQDVLKEVVKKE